MRVKYSQKSVDYLNENIKNRLVLEGFSFENCDFLNEDKPIYIEIGPGKGKFICDLASKNPDKNFIVCELNDTISGYCLKKIDESNLTNVRLVAGDFYKFASLIKPNSIEGIFLNFSDPWPKKRHVKRRLTHDNFFKEYYKILKMHGLIRYKSDNYDFYLYSKEQAEKFKYKFLVINEDYNEDDEFDAMTEYEVKFRNKGVKINRMILEKTEDTIDEIK